MPPPRVHTFHRTAACGGVYCHAEQKSDTRCSRCAFYDRAATRHQFLMPLDETICSEISETLHGELLYHRVDGVLDVAAFVAAHGHAPACGSIFVFGEGGSYVFTDADGVEIGIRNGTLCAFTHESRAYTNTLRLRCIAARPPLPVALDALRVCVYRAMHAATAAGASQFDVHVDAERFASLTSAHVDVLVAHLRDETRFVTRVLSCGGATWLKCTFV